MSVAQFMAACLYDPEGGYYARAPRIGADGDFITAPEISQMFGELIGLWCAHEWDALARPSQTRWIELGPGRGALTADALRAVRASPQFAEALDVHFIELSDELRRAQASALTQIRPAWHDRLEDAPEGPAFIIANEFFDCLPVRQFVRAENGWRERLVGLRDGELSFGLSASPLPDVSLLPIAAQEAEIGAIAELAPALPAWIAAIAARLKAHPGRALIIDYGGDGMGDTLQALSRHRKVSPLENPGECDLTAHVDFTALANAALDAGLGVSGPIAQGAWLAALGVEARAAALARANPARAERIAREHRRLTHPDEMGALFQVLCLSSPTLPTPAGF
ncbi:MAG: class I SAM-dependent methyltransferase [Hyphomonadaceae bacterium]